MKSTTSLVVPFVVCLSAVGGCGFGEETRERMPVKGQVTLNGKPLDNAIIWFEPLEDGAGPSSAAKIVNGNFEIAQDGGAVVGQHQIQLFAYRANPNFSNEAATPGPPGPGGAPMSSAGAAAEINIIPANYNIDTELKATVELGKDNVFDFDVIADWTGE